MSGKSPTLDLHGFRPEDVWTAVEEFLLRYTNTKQVRIMPGKGTGKVKAQVVDYLKRANYPWKYERLNNGQPNEGVMVVYMD